VWSSSKSIEAIAKQAKWTNEVKVLQLRTLLTGEAKEVSQLANKNYEELRKALVDRFGRRPHQYFADLLEVKRGENVLCNLTFSLDDDAFGEMVGKM
jgi:hypothetical protein